MNKFNQWLALKLINRKIKKMERKAAKWLLICNQAGKREQTLLNAIDDPQEYQRLRYLRENITNINAPWQGVFAHWWMVWPKDVKYIEAFEPFEITGPELLPLGPEDQAWAELDNREFLERLALEEAGYENSTLEKIGGFKDATIYKITDKEWLETEGQRFAEEEWINHS